MMNEQGLEVHHDTYWMIYGHRFIHWCDLWWQLKRIKVRCVCASRSQYV